MVKHAVVRRVSKQFQFGLTSSNLGKPDYNAAIKQHSDYIEAMKKCGLNVKILEADDRFPDSTFVEDTAVVNKDFVVISNLGAPSRKGEEKDIKKVMEEFYDEFVEKGDSPTADGHDMTPDKWNGRYKDEENLIYRIESFFKGNLTSLVQQSKEELKKDMLIKTKEWHGTGNAIVNDYFNSLNHE